MIRGDRCIICAHAWTQRAAAGGSDEVIEGIAVFYSLTRGHLVWQGGQIAVDPTRPNLLFALTSRCLSRSTDEGRSWGACEGAPGLGGIFSKLLVRDGQTMFMQNNAGAKGR